MKGNPVSSFNGTKNGILSENNSFAASEVPEHLDMEEMHCFRLPWWLRQWRICLQCRTPGFSP